MSTRSFIGIQGIDSITAIYCHSDGYPSGVGAVLAEHYTDAKKVRALVALGDCSALHAEIGEKHSFNARPVGQSTFYHRDRGEAWESVKPTIVNDEAEFLAVAETVDAEYAYLYRDGTWLCYDGNGHSWPAPVPLADAIKADTA